MKREGLNVELNRGKLWIYPCSGYRRIIINNPYPQNRKADRGGRETKTIINNKFDWTEEMTRRACICTNNENQYRNKITCKKVKKTATITKETKD